MLDVSGSAASTSGRSGDAAEFTASGGVFLEWLCVYTEQEIESTAAAAVPRHEDPEYMEMKGIKLTGRPLYLDMQATTPIDPRVIDAMLPYFTDQYGNPHSRTHMYGWESEDAVEKSRKQVGKCHTHNVHVAVQRNWLHWQFTVHIQSEHYVRYRN